MPTGEAAAQLGGIDHDGIQGAVETATGPVGLVIIAIYSFLIVFVLPPPSEVALAAPLDLGIMEWTETGLIILVSGLGKAVGSVVAFYGGQRAKQSGPI